MDIMEEVLYEIFLDLHKAYNALDPGRCLDTLATYVVGPGPDPSPEVLGPPINCIKGEWIILGPSKGPERCDSGGLAIPQDLQLGGRRVPLALGLHGGSKGWGSGYRYRGVRMGHSMAGGIILCR